MVDEAAQADEVLEREGHRLPPFASQASTFTRSSSTNEGSAREKEEEFTEHFSNQFLYFRYAASAGSSRLGEMGHLLSSMQPVLRNDFFQETVGETETFTDDLPLLLAGRTDGAAIDGDPGVLVRLMGMLEAPDPDFTIVTP